MAKLAQALSAPSPYRSFDPVRFAGSSRLTFKRLRRPTPLPVMALSGSVDRLLNCLGGLFGR